MLPLHVCSGPYHSLLFLQESARQIMKKHLGPLTAEEDQLSEFGAHGSDGQDVPAVRNALLKHE